MSPDKIFRLTHWDVNNEQQHGDWYEQKVGDQEIMEWMFEETYRQDPNVLLFLNDFAVVRDGQQTVVRVYFTSYAFAYF